MDGKIGWHWPMRNRGRFSGCRGASRPNIFLARKNQTVTRRNKSSSSSIAAAKNRGDTTGVAISSAASHPDGCLSCARAANARALNTVWRNPGTECPVFGVILGDRRTLCIRESQSRKTIVRIRGEEHSSKRRRK